MNRVDLAVIAVYLAGVAGVGIALRGRQEGVGDYFLGSRRVAWPLILLSIVATETSTVTFLSVPGKAFARDMAFLQIALGYVLGRCAVAIVLMPHFFRGQALTLYQILGQRFGSGVQRVSSVLFLATRSIADGLRLYLTAIVLQQLTQWSFAVAIVAVGVATIVYTFVGGIRAVIWTDFLQFFIYVLGALVAGLVLLDRVGGGWGTVLQVGAAQGKFDVFRFSFDPTASQTFWAGLVGGAFLSAATHGADQMMVQRYLCTESLPHARLALVSSGVLVLAQFAAFLVLGVGLFVFYEQYPPAVPFARSDEVFVQFIVREVPVGLRGLIIAAVFAAAMSTLSGSLNSISSAAVADLYRPLVRPEAGERHYLVVSRLLTVVAGLVQIGVALYGRAMPGRSTVDRVLEVAGFTTGITLGVLLLGVLVRRAGQSAAMVAMIMGAAVMSVVWLFTPIDGWWYALIGSVTTLLAGYLASRVARQRSTS
jgi:SSS family transporter